jgi:uncharacterized protein YkwD
MKSRRSPGEVLAILFLLTIMAVVVVFPALSSGCNAGEICINGAGENQQGFQPFRNLLVSASDCPTTFEQMVILLINAERANQGLPALLLDIRLQDAARWFADDLAIYGLQDPVDYDSRGKSQDYRLRVEREYDYDWKDETIALGSGPDTLADTPEEVVAGWMNSHSAVLLSPSADHIGVGYVDREGLLWDDVTVADFASPDEPGEIRQPPLSTCDPGFHRMYFPIIFK